MLLDWRWIHRCADGFIILFSIVRGGGRAIDLDQCLDMAGLWQGLCRDVCLRCWLLVGIFEIVVSHEFGRKDQYWAEREGVCGQASKQ